MIGFVRGYAYEVQIIQILNPELAVDYVFGIENKWIEERNRSRVVDDEAARLTPLMQGSDGIFFRRCLNDLSMAMKHPDDAAFYCFRAIESLKQYCRSRYEIEKEPDQWKKLSALTGAGREEVQFIRELAFPARHGDVVALTNDDRQKLLLKTWDIVDAFVEKV